MDVVDALGGQASPAAWRWAQQLVWPDQSLRLKMKFMQTHCPGVTVLFFFFFFLFIFLLGTIQNVQFSQQTPEDL